MPQQLDNRIEVTSIRSKSNDHHESSAYRSAAILAPIDTHEKNTKAIIGQCYEKGLKKVRKTCDPKPWISSKASKSVVVSRNQAWLWRKFWLCQGTSSQVDFLYREKKNFCTVSKTNENGVVVIHSEKTERGVLHINEEKKVLCVWKLGKGNSEKNTCRPFARLKSSKIWKEFGTLPRKTCCIRKAYWLLSSFGFFFNFCKWFFFYFRQLIDDKWTQKKGVLYVLKAFRRKT